MNRSLGAGDVMPGPFSLLIVLIHRDADKGCSRKLRRIKRGPGLLRPGLHLLFAANSQPLAKSFEDAAHLFAIVCT